MRGSNYSPIEVIIITGINSSCLDSSLNRQVGGKGFLQPGTGDHGINPDRRTETKRRI